MIFGVFDRLHAGHLAFIEQARAYGDEVIAVVARDEIVGRLKKKNPHNSEEVRMQAVREVGGINHVVLGDEQMGAYGVLHAYMPNVICIGYDQQELEYDLRDRINRGLLPEIEIIRLEPYEPERFHTSLLIETERVV